MTHAPADTTVLVTGVSGFIGLHCALELLRQGYRVRGTVRSLDRVTALRQTLTTHLGAGADASLAGDRLSFTTADLSDDAGWDDTVRGCRYVLHVASPLPVELPKHEDDLIIPARDGALRVLRAAAATGVSRVVMTSSVAAVLYGHECDGSRTYDEDDWSRVEVIQPYPKSKTLAERAAWDFVKTLDGDDAMELVVINPGLVLGPLLSANFSASGEVVRKLMKREFPGCPALGWAPVDVRDVVSAHIAAMTTPEAAGQRFVCAVDHAWMSDIAAILKQHFGDRYRIPTRKLPNFLTRFVALFDKAAKSVVHNLGKREDISNERIKRVLGWQPRSLEDMVVAMAESMIEYGVV